MPFRRTERSTYYLVSGVETMDVGHNPKSAQFLPEVVHVNEVEGSPTRFDISGPQLSRQGKPLKTLRGGTAFDMEDIRRGKTVAEDTGEDLEVIPEWLIDLAGEISDPPLRLNELEIRALLKAGNLGDTVGLPRAEHAALGGALGVLTSALNQLVKETHV